MSGYEKSLRDWQVKCLKKLDDLFTQSKRALVVATPGGGKTRLALTFATQLVRDGKIDHVHIVAPTRPLCRQWQLAAAESGIYLGRRSNSRLRDAQLPLDIGGVITTYSQVAHDADAHLANMENRNALVILDECHHPADRRAWGDAISQAFDGSARFVLSLSGTPFRDDGHRISLISYTPDGVSKSDFNYTYGEAIADDVCRPVIFKHYNALVQYKMRGEKFAYNFSDDVPQNQMSELLRHALHPEAGLVEQMVRDADDEISAIRSRGPRWGDAAGLLVAMSIQHAYACAAVVKDVTGEDPMVVVSDDDASHENLEAFKNGMGRWIIAVRMISEGVDIPRLMVSVYATNVTATLFFRQFVGRTVRVRHRGAEEVSTIFIPSDPRIVKEAADIEEEVHRFLKDAPPDKFTAVRSQRMTALSEKAIPNVQDIDQQGAFFRGMELQQTELDYAESVRDIFPLGDRLSAAQIAYTLRKLGEIRDVQR
jgi:superfamily II DNA or RNA helicase